MGEPFLLLGAAAAKTLCKIWLKDSDLAAQAGITLTDLVTTKIFDTREQRRARRLFEDIEEKVADRVLNVLDHEFRQVPGNEREAAVRAVGTALDGARLTDRDLFENDLDPLFLERHITEGAREPVLDSPGTRALYDRVLAESCAYIVEIAHELPSFGTRAFAEVLRRQTEMRDRIDEILDRIPERESIAGDQRAADFLTAYRQQVVSRLDHLELFGVTLSDPLRRYPLSAAYIDLTIGASPRADLWRPATWTPRARSLPAGTGLHLEDVLSVTKRLFVRGEAGSGKTTLLQSIAVRAARRGFDADLADWNETVPFLIRLRRYVATDFPTPERFVTEIGRHIAAEMPPGWVHDLLRDGRALMLVDGIDELPEHRRLRAREWLEDLLTAFPDARWIVTSRPAAVRVDWLSRDDFAAVELRPMSPADIRGFVRHWHAALSNGIDADLDAYETKLLAALESRSHLRYLSRSPLLCAMLCALNLDRRAQLPRDRMELYEAALDMLLERRDYEREVGDHGLSRTQKTVILRGLAYWLLRNGQSDVSRTDANAQIKATLSTMPNAPDLAPEMVLAHLLDRSGMLREPVPGRIDFVHRTFQEYLAARAAIDADDLGLLVTRAHDDQWFQVVVLAVGHACLRQRDRLLSDLMFRAKRYAGLRHRLHLVAIASLEVAAQLSPQVRDDIVRTAEGLVPPRTAGDANALSNVGELALDLLADRPPRTAAEAAATITAARLIGGDAALPIIARSAEYGTDTAEEDDAVQYELLNAWSCFDRDEFARRVFAATGRTNLVVLDAESFSSVHLIPTLEGLAIRLPPGSAGDLDLTLEPLRKLPLLKVVMIFMDAGFCDPHILGELPSLTCLSLVEFNGSADLSALVPASLRNLVIYDAGPVDLRPLAGREDLSISVAVPRRAIGADQLGPRSRVRQIPSEVDVRLRPGGLRGVT